MSVDEYLKQLTEQEKHVLEIAKDHLGDSFDIERSIGFQAWTQKQNIASQNIASQNTTSTKIIKKKKTSYKEKKSTKEIIIVLSCFVKDY